jgi:hypothetical protein
VFEPLVLEECASQAGAHVLIPSLYPQCMGALLAASHAIRRYPIYPAQLPTSVFPLMSDRDFVVNDRNVSCAKCAGTTVHYEQTVRERAWEPWPQVCRGEDDYSRPANIGAVFKSERVNGFHVVQFVLGVGPAR